jgi:choice-of-anchor B domain-containing protein
MNKLFLLLFCLPIYTWAQYDHYNLTLLSHYNDPSIPTVDGDQIWSDVTGWADTVKHREYLISGSPDSLFFFDITNPAQMVKCDVEFGHSRNAVNRDYELYDHYVYCVSDRTSPLGSLQIFDLQYLPDSVHKVYDNDTFSIQSHTIFIEAKSKRLYLCGNYHNNPPANRSMTILSLADPEKPTFLGELDKNSGCAYTHEVFVQNDTAYCSCGPSGLFIYDLTNPQQTKLISSIVAPYPGNGYNHSSWLDSTNRYLMFTDENQGSPVKVYDINQIGSPDLVTYFNSHPKALPHNAYWKGRFAYTSSYEDGVYVFDMQHPELLSPSNPPPVAGYFDTYPKNAPGVYSGFHGCWGVWPFLPSGVILASDISEGLFVLKASPTLSVPEWQSNIVHTSVFPNPFTTAFTLHVQTQSSEIVSVGVYTLEGKKMFGKQITLNAGQNDVFIDGIENMAPGLYLLSIQGPLSLNVQKPILKID